MNCKNCECWYKNVPFNWLNEQPAEIKQQAEITGWGFCTVLSDITFADAGCEADATQEDRDNAIPLIKDDVA